MPKSKTDHAVAVFKAALSAVPYVGGPMASLISDYVPASTQRALAESVALLQRNLEELAARIDPAGVDADEFAEVFKSAYLELVRTYKANKRQAAIGIVVNAMLKRDDPAKLRFEELDHFARSLGSLSSGALELLCAAVDHSKPQREGIPRRKLTFSELDEAFPDWGSDLVMGLASELHGTNLVHVTQVGGVRTDNYGNYPVEVTDLGVRFVEYVLRLAT